MPTPRLRVPASAAKGEVFEVKTTVEHEMESGQRKAPDGSLIPRKIIHRMVALYNGREVFRTEMAPAVSANPYFSFFLTASESGTIEVTWFDDDGQVYSASAPITVG